MVYIVYNNGKGWIAYYPKGAWWDEHWEGARKGQQDAQKVTRTWGNEILENMRRKHSYTYDYMAKYFSLEPLLSVPKQLIIDFQPA